ncbi:transcription factor GTE12-like isoform X1 [Salvia splendens]|uniref:transcription factor GTE12-like isoform X1 n=1 Tax=Salvia splendens TaxID=180675 RepID=UPI001C25F984|nr:transcription factor GTE12-like isoform X1 [Salvia splendens]
MEANQTQTMSCYATTNKTARCPLKFKVTPKGVWPIVEDKLLVGTDGTRMPSTVKPSVQLNSGKRKPEMPLDGQRYKKQKMPIDDQWQRKRVSVAVTKKLEANVLLKPSHKRGPETSLDDHSWKLECSKILKGLMDRRPSQAFSKPVDPVKTPDYFKMIKNPMDLGTIKHKLERNMYSAAKEFADDVLLTFGNAMSYHPPSSEVYRSARLLKCNFGRMWEILDAKLKPVVENNHQVMKPAADLVKAPVPEKRGNSRRTSLEKRLKSKPWIKHVKPRKTALNGFSLMSTIVDEELAIDARTRGAAPNEEKNPCSTSATTPASEDLNMIMNSFTLFIIDYSSIGFMAGVPMSPKKALRVAMLKSRFANTIFKATHPSLDEKTRIEKQLEAAEIASRERERNAARMALEMMEKAAEIDSPPNMLNDMDILFGCYPNSKSLEQIGLFLKVNYLEDVEEDDPEEGELF